MYRLATQQDFPALEVALTRLSAYAASYEWATGKCAVTANANLRAEIHRNHGYIVGGYLVMVDAYQPWYSKDYVLQEWLVMRLYEPTGTEAIPAALLQIAKEHNCVAVISGDSSPVNIMAGTYKQAGWFPLTSSFYKRVDNGIRQESSG